MNIRKSLFPPIIGLAVVAPIEIGAFIIFGLTGSVIAVVPGIIASVITMVCVFFMIDRKVYVSLNEQGISALKPKIDLLPWSEIVSAEYEQSRLRYLVHVKLRNMKTVSIDVMGLERSPREIAEKINSNL